MISFASIRFSLLLILKLLVLPIVLALGIIALAANIVAFAFSLIQVACYYIAGAIVEEIPKFKK